jgi:hypothetical protein
MTVVAGIAPKFLHHDIYIYIVMHDSSIFINTEERRKIINKTQMCIVALREMKEGNYKAFAVIQMQTS